MVMRLFVLSSPLVFPTMPVGVNEHHHQHGEGDEGKDDHRGSRLPGLMQELETIMDHSP